MKNFAVPVFLLIFAGGLKAQQFQSKPSDSLSNNLFGLLEGKNKPYTTFFDPKFNLKPSAIPGFVSGSLLASNTWNVDRMPIIMLKDGSKMQ